MKRDLDGAPRHVTVKPSWLAVAVDYLCDLRFFVGVVVGAYITTVAAFAWSFYL